MMKHGLLALRLAGLLYTVSPAMGQGSGNGDQQAAPAAAPP
jgi:hypothetical protein